MDKKIKRIEDLLGILNIKSFDLNSYYDDYLIISSAHHSLLDFIFDNISTGTFYEHNVRISINLKNKYIYSTLDELEEILVDLNKYDNVEEFLLWIKLK